MARPDIGRKKRAFYTNLTQDEYNLTLRNTKALKRLYGVQRATLMRVIFTKLLTDEEFINIVHVKGGLRIKKLK